MLRALRREFCGVCCDFEVLVVILVVFFAVRYKIRVDVPNLCNIEAFGSDFGEEIRLWKD